MLEHKFMGPAFGAIWTQPLYPLGSPSLSAIAACLPLVLVLALMGVLRKSSLFASACGLAATALLAVLLWGMPLGLALASTGYGIVYAVWPVMWIVFAGLWLYNMSSRIGNFELLRNWMARHASGDPCIQVLLVAFCFGALLESCAGFGAPVAVTAFLLVALGFDGQKAVVVALVANTAPVGFGGMGIPIVALRDVTGLDLLKLSSMVGRQLPFLSVMIPFCLLWIVGGRKGLRRAWPAALVSGASYALAQFLVSNFWGPYAADLIAASMSIAALTGFLHLWTPRGSEVSTSPVKAPNVIHPSHSKAPLSSNRASLAGWIPWAVLSIVMVLWSYFKLFQKGQLSLPIPTLHNAIFVTIHNKAYEAIYRFRPLDVGSAVLTAVALTSVLLRVRPKYILESGLQTIRQVRVPTATVMLIVGLAYLYNYSGMAFTLGGAIAQIGPAFPLLSSYLGWVACLLSGSDTASNLLFGKLQVAAAQQLHLSPILLAATNSSGGVISKMISPQNIAVGVTTVGLVGQEGKILRQTFWLSVILAALLGLLAFAQAYWLTWMIPGTP